MKPGIGAILNYRISLRKYLDKKINVCRQLIRNPKIRKDPSKVQSILGQAAALIDIKRDFKLDKFKIDREGI